MNSITPPARRAKRTKVGQSPWDTDRAVAARRRNSGYQNAFEQAEMIVQAALDPSVASKARKGDFVACLDHFDLRQTPVN
jgi:hypothetical protein